MKLQILEDRRPPKLIMVRARPYDRGVSILFREALAILFLIKLPLLANIVAIRGNS